MSGMTIMFGPSRCHLCGKGHYKGSQCPEPPRTSFTTISFKDHPEEEHRWVAPTSGRIVKADAEAAFIAWERDHDFHWRDGRERQGAITAFSAGWIAAEDHAAGLQSLNERGQGHE